MTKPSEQARCAICKSGARETVQTQSLALLARSEPCAIDFAVCSDCGHLQQWPPVPPDVMRHHYGTFAAYELHGDGEKLRAAAPSRHAARFLSLARDIGLAPGRVYEIGCASGEMLNQFRRQGWTVQGCDPSPSAIAQAKAIFDITADPGGEEENLPHQRNLDLIVICHVLEHLYDPGAALRRCHHALSAGGHLLLEVPCAIAPETLPPGWFTFEHLHYYQPTILDRLLRQAGFEPVELRIQMTAQHYPVIAIAARKTPDQTAQTASSLPQASIAMARQYADRDKALWAAAAAKLADLACPVFIYGAGIHTAQLLDHTDLAEKAQIIAIVDRDSKKWGQSLAGKAVIGPEQLFEDPSNAPVIISSYVSERAIIGMLLDRGIAASRIRPLYCELPA